MALLRAHLCVIITFFAIELSCSADGFFFPKTTSSIIFRNNDSQLQEAREVFSLSDDGTMTGIPPGGGSTGKKKKKKKKSTMSKKERQRTGNGTIDSNDNNGARSLDPSLQGVQVVRGTRGSKSVTIIRGMNATPLDEKKKILKKFKGKLGVGGTIVDGVLELQGGGHVETVISMLKDIGYEKARKI